MLSSGELAQVRTDALANAGTVYGMLIELNKLAVAGDQNEVNRGLAKLAEAVEGELAIVQLIMATERQTAKAMDRTQSTLARIFGRPLAHENPDAANDEHPVSPVQSPPLS